MGQLLTNLTSQQLSQWLTEASQAANKGKLPNYIPLLQQTAPNLLAVCILPINHQINAQGDIDKTFPLMSIIKPFLLFYLLSQLGKEFIFNKVGRDPSNYPFNSLEQLQIDQGFPRNPMINSGAITLASLLPGKDGKTRSKNLQEWLNKQANCHLFLDKLMLKSVQSLPNIRNQAILQELVKQNQINEPEITLDAYNQICCLSGTIIDLARLGLLLVNCSPSLSQENCLIVREIMTTCGLYEASENFAKKVGFPTKSGVSGAILSLVPEQGAIACYSPPLDAEGNSISSLFIIKKIAQFLAS
ncbi:glutaminase [Crocosphaera sp. XPORK-15E]|uniref:glutaminase n=1 Tax=Crocosphaera sp. XPORK-15E TaxID=3110247 RepID=UPI002B204924|nr:glutaminase [Crocosphaera sp. XPORK-15E]MEA5534798.1 glutaminase [Crocosphaera sp. XPORK-15E]